MYLLERKFEFIFIRGRMLEEDIYGRWATFLVFYLDRDRDCDLYLDRYFDRFFLFIGYGFDLL